MKIVIAGCGKIGTSLIKCLCKEDHSITVIEKDRKKLEEIMNNYDVGGVLGNAVVVDIQKEASVSKCSIFIAVTENDELNLVCCKVAKELGAKKVIARVRNTDYTDQAELMKIGFDIDMVINPELATAKEIHNMLRFPFSRGVSTFEKGKVVSVEIEVSKIPEVVDKTIKQIVEEYDAKMVVSAILRGEELIIPKGDEVLKEGDVISLTSNPEVLDHFFKKVGIHSHRAKSVLIVGGSRIAYHLSRLLKDAGTKIKIIDSDESKCGILSEVIENAEVVNADGTQKQILEEEGLSNFDACLSLTGYDEENIIISLFAKSNGVKTIITKVNNENLYSVLDGINLNSKVSPKIVTTNHIIYFTRSLKSKEENTIERVRLAMDGKYEILEFNVNGNAELSNKAIKDLKLKDGVLITCIVRNGKAIIPNGDEVFEGEDKVIVATGSKIHSLDNILR